MAFVMAAVLRAETGVLAAPGGPVVCPVPVPAPAPTPPCGFAFKKSYS